MPAPRLAPHVERPACPIPEHVGGYVWLDGIYTSNDAHARTRYKCAPRAGQPDAWKRHPFYVPLPRREPRGTLAVLDRTCDECEHVLARSEGPITARRFIFTAREAGKALRDVAFGGTYKEVSQAVRQHAHRERLDGDGSRSTSEHGSLAADYLDLFADVVYDHFAPTAWPEIVALDALPFRVRAWEDGRAVRGGKPKASVLGAFGYPEAGRRGRVWHVAVSGGLDQLSWEAFLRSMPQDPERPVRYVVCDDDTALQLAVAAVWPQAAVYVSEEAIQRGGLEAIGKAKKLGGRRADAEAAIRSCTWSRRHWRELEELARILPPDGVALRAWVALKRPLMERQWRARQAKHPRSAGALEQFFTVLKDVIGIRRYRFRNAHRLERLAKMVMLRHRKEADERAYARIVRKHLEAHGGRPEVRFRSRDRTDTRGEPSSIKRLEAEAIERQASALGITIPPGTTNQQARRLIKGARYRRNDARRLDAMTPEERVAEEARRREKSRASAQARRDREDAEREAAGLPPKRRAGPRGPYKARPAPTETVLTPEQLAGGGEEF